jgi:transcriptional regulator with XRE-family HTH domain
MLLKAWLTAHKMSDAEFARLSGIGQRALVQKYRHGRQFPAPENLRRIREATNGAVTADDFVDQHAGASPPPPTPPPPSPKRRKRTPPPADATPPKQDEAA